MPVQTSIALLVTVAVAIAGFIAVHLLRRRGRAEELEAAAPAATDGEPAPEDAPPDIPYTTEAI